MLASARVACAGRAEEQGSGQPAALSSGRHWRSLSERSSPRAAGQMGAIASERSDLHDAMNAIGPEDGELTLIVTAEVDHSALALAGAG